MRNSGCAATALRAARSAHARLAAPAAGLVDHLGEGGDGRGLQEQGRERKLDAELIVNALEQTDRREGAAAEVEEIVVQVDRVRRSR